MEEQDKSTIIGLTAEIVSAYLSNNAARPADIPDLLVTIHGALSKLGSAPSEPVVETREPAVPIKKSVTNDYIVSLEDGRKFKSLKRHLATEYGMTPNDYRTKWGLPKDYPMVAPSYAKQRSEMAKNIGLGRKPKDEAAEPQDDTAQSEPAKKRGRAKAA